MPYAADLPKTCRGRQCDPTIEPLPLGESDVPTDPAVIAMRTLRQCSTEQRYVLTVLLGKHCPNLLLICRRGNLSWKNEMRRDAVR